MRNRLVCGLAGGSLTIPGACDRVEDKEKRARKRLGERVMKGQMAKGELEVEE